MKKKDTSGKEPKAPLLLENVMRRILQQGFPVTGNHCLQDVPIDIFIILDWKLSANIRAIPESAAAFPAVYSSLWYFRELKKSRNI
jgi:hypothetical protein